MTTIVPCPVCTRPYTPEERQCPQCGWELEGAYMLGPITPEIQAAFEHDVALCRQAHHLAQAQARIAELEHNRYKQQAQERIDSVDAEIHRYSMWMLNFLLSI